MLRFLLLLCLFTSGFLLTTKDNQFEKTATKFLRLGYLPKEVTLDDVTIVNDSESEASEGIIQRIDEPDEEINELQLEENSQLQGHIEADQEESISTSTVTTAPTTLVPLQELFSQTAAQVTITPEVSTNTSLSSKVDEVINLPRGNCNMEIHVHEAEDKKLSLRFGLLEKSQAGQCQISLYGDDGVMLAVLITEVKLYHGRNAQLECQGDETLRIVTTNTGINFTIKQYCGNENHYPVILTETNKAYIMLTYNRTSLVEPLEETSFLLEVFSYLKYENHLEKPTEQQQTLVYPQSNQNVENIYFTTITPEP